MKNSSFTGNFIRDFENEKWFFDFVSLSTKVPFKDSGSFQEVVDLHANNCKEHYLGSCFLKNFIVAINVLISITTTLGNVFVILAFYLDRQIRQPSNLFLCSLGVSDFFIGTFSIPFLTAYIYANQRWPFNTFCCDLWLSVDYTLKADVSKSLVEKSAKCLISIWTVLFITIDRYCSVKIPAKYRRLRTRRRVQLAICASWAVPSLIFFGATFLYPKFSKEKKENLDPETGVCDVRWKENKYFNLFLTLAYFWVTLLVMIVLYVQIYRIASNLEKKSRDKAKRMASLVESSDRTMKSIAAITFNRSAKLPACVNQSSSNNYEESSSSTSHQNTISELSSVGDLSL
ncbi:hypothetical protein ACOME3_004870 [Neoechinorhynchus agilis]